MHVQQFGQSKKRSSLLLKFTALMQQNQQQGKRQEGASPYGSFQGRE
jgi:hypothetical protein